MALALGLSLAISLGRQQGTVFEFKDTEKSVIIKAFFKREIDVVPVIDNRIKGKSSVRIERAPFEIMLAQVLKPLDATYRYEAGKFTILPRRKK